jgi:hypothetical protein
VFLKSSPPEIKILHEANQLLKQSLQAKEILKTPITRYVCNIIRQRETNNLRAILKKRTERKKGKRAILKGQFHISTEEIRKQVVAAEEETRNKKKKRQGKSRGKPVLRAPRAVSEDSEDPEDLQYIEIFGEAGLRD